MLRGNKMKLSQLKHNEIWQDLDFIAREGMTDDELLAWLEELVEFQETAIWVRSLMKSIEVKNESS